ncbi:MAG: arsenite methyltransferase [Nanoarchaeota archaeon]
MEKEKIKDIVKKGYASIASDDCGCGCCSCSKKEIDNQIAKQIGYSDQELSIAPDANMGLGCGNPIALGRIKPGEIVIDLGSGAGFDCFLASKKVGERGKVIGIDMTKEMIKKAKKNAKKYKFSNVKFKLGEIENLPINDNYADVVISNCVINLSSDKLRVYKEAYRILKKNGKMYVSDIVLLKNLTDEQRKNPDLICSCVGGGALLRDDYLNIIKKAGFKINIIDEDKKISKSQYQGIPLESLKLELTK